MKLKSMLGKIFQEDVLFRPEDTQSCTWFLKIN